MEYEARRETRARGIRAREDGPGEYEFAEQGRDEDRTQRGIDCCDHGQAGAGKQRPGGEFRELGIDRARMPELVADDGELVRTTENRSAG